MKKNNFRINRLRRKLEKNENWLRNYVNRLQGDENYWNDFKKLHCSDFFVGYQTSLINTEIYSKRIDQVEHRFRLAKKVCKRVYNKELGELYI